MTRSYSLTVLVATAVIIAVLAFLLGIWWRDRYETAEESPTPTESPVLTYSPLPSVSPSVSVRPSVLRTVSFTETGPVPESLSILKGDSVAFVNNTGNAIWPVSIDCPFLNAGRGLNTGESYTLSFPNRTTCTYHNNLNGYNNIESGTIIVR